MFANSFELYYIIRYKSSPLLKWINDEEVSKLGRSAYLSEFSLAIVDLFTVQHNTTQVLTNLIGGKFSMFISFYLHKTLLQVLISNCIT